MPVSMTLVPKDLEIRLRDLPRPWRWEEIFGDARPVEVEIGTGNGAFLVDAALRSQEHAFLGIEVAGKFFGKALRRAAREGASNVRMVHVDAAYLLHHCIPPASVAAYHVYFPEPWPKKRHAKRRLFQPDVVARLTETLQPGGYLLVATDVADYFEAITALLDREARLGRLEARPPPLASTRGRIMTSYEKKYRAEGRFIHYAVWRRRPDGPEEAEAPRAVAPVEAPKEEPMPHVVVEHPMKLLDYVGSFQPLIHQEGTTVCKATEAYVNSAGTAALLTAVVVEEGLPQTFFVLVSEKPGQTTVRLLRLTDPEKTPGVKRLLALVAKDLLDHSPGAAYGATNIEPFLFPVARGEGS
ncbi:MAG: tRNA (guanosine(46)-N7)-methyltransferase TrmB [Candidatus Tectimicrobiota bacterium]